MFFSIIQINWSHFARSGQSIDL